MTLSLTADLGTFTFAASEAPIPGTDSDWNYTPSIQSTIPLGATKNSIIYMGRGSGFRTWQSRMTQARWRTLQALQGTNASFTDWEGELRGVYVQTVRRDSGSRPFLVNVTIELVEQ